VNSHESTFHGRERGLGVGRHQTLRVVVISHLLPAVTKKADYLASIMGIWHQLSRRCSTVTFLCAADGPEMSEAVSRLSSNTLTILPLLARAQRSVVLRRLSDLEPTIRSLQPEVVHVLGEPWQRGTIDAVRAAKAVGALVGVHFAENGPALRGGGGWLRRQGGRRGLAVADYAVGWSSAAAMLANEVWGVRVPVSVFPSVGIPQASFQTSPREWHQRRKRMLFAGRLVEEKGVLDVLEVSRRLQPQGIRCTIVGEGPLRPVVLAAQSKGVVDYLGRIPRSAVANAMAQAGVTLVPSRPGALPGPFGIRIPSGEQFGLVIAESLAAGTPVTAYRVGAIPEVVGSGGSIVDAGDVDGLVEATQQLLGNEERWRQTAEDGRIWAKRFSDERIAEQLCRLWDRLF
jgi:glycosyltransferase involved in cell wall biosynthesis